MRHVDKAAAGDVSYPDLDVLLPLAHAAKGFLLRFHLVDSRLAAELRQSLLPPLLPLHWLELKLHLLKLRRLLELLREDRELGVQVPAVVELVRNRAVATALDPHAHFLL